MAVFDSIVHCLSTLVGSPTCCVCRSPVGRADGAICGNCHASQVRLAAPLCPRCSLPLPCRPCPAAGMAFDRSYAPFSYEGASRRAVTALKFQRRFALSNWMGGQIALGLAERIGSADSPLVVVPVPIHPSRLRQRGFNQAELLARSLARQLELPFQNPLRRAGKSTAQRVLSRDVRMARTDLKIVTRSKVPHTVFLIDDVYTTGATLDFAAQTLKAAGASRVLCAVYARALSTKPVSDYG